MGDLDAWNEYERMKKKHSRCFNYPLPDIDNMENKADQIDKLKDILVDLFGMSYSESMMVINLCERLTPRPEAARVAFFDLAKLGSKSVITQVTSLQNGGKFEGTPEMIEQLKKSVQELEQQTSKRGKNLKQDKSKKHKYSQSKHK